MRLLISPDLLILALCAFSIGTTEFVIIGLLPEVSSDLNVSVPAARWLITAYALFLIGVGLPLGNIISGRFADRHLPATLGLLAIQLARRQGTAPQIGQR